MALFQAGSTLPIYYLGAKEIGCNCTRFFLSLISLSWRIRKNISGEFLVPYFFSRLVSEIEALTYLMQTGFVVYGRKSLRDLLLLFAPQMFPHAITIEMSAKSLLKFPNKVKDVRWTISSHVPREKNRFPIHSF